MAYNTFANLANAIWNQQAQVTDQRPLTDVINSWLQQFQNNPTVGSIFSWILNNRNDAIGNTQNSILGMYDAYQQATNPTFQNYVAQTVPFWQKLLGDISTQEQELRGMWGPQGTQYQLLDDYYTRMAKLVEQRARGNQASIDAAARASGASRGGVAASRNKQAMADTDSLLKFQEGKANALMSAYNTFSQLLGGLQDRSANIRSQFVINPYLELVKRQDALAQSALENQAALEQMRLQRASGPSQMDQWNAFLNQQLAGNPTVQNANKIQQDQLTQAEIMSQFFKNYTPIPGTWTA